MRKVILDYIFFLIITLGTSVSAQVYTHPDNLASHDTDENMVSKYVGQVNEQSLPHGRGKMNFANGDYYEGDFVNGKRTGKGTLKFANGNIYEGDFVNDMPHGKGTLKFANGDIYEGDVVNDKMTGKGTYKFASGTSYEGDFVNGMPHGKGTLKFANGDIYEGDFVNKDKSTLKFANDVIYQVDFENSMTTGKGTVKFANGDIYEGDFVDGRTTGKGILKQANGDQYEGDFLRGAMHGLGVYTSASGNRREGKFEYNQYVGTNKTSSNDVITETQPPRRETNGMASGCRTNTSYLGARIPNFRVSELQEQRRNALSENIMLAMQRAKQQGYAPNQAVTAALQQAREFDKTAKEALRTAASVDAIGTTDEEFLAKLNNRSLDVPNCDNMRNSALCVAIVNKIAAITTRAVAAEMQCHIRAGTWATSSSNTSSSPRDITTIEP